MNPSPLPTREEIHTAYEQGEEVDYLLGMSDDPRTRVGDPALDANEQAMLDTYRREGWSGIARLSVERLSK